MKKLFQGRLAAVLLLPFCILFRGHCDVLTLRPSTDAYMRQLMADLNLGSGPLFAGAVGNMNSREIRRAVMRFDLSGQIPAGATVNSVTLTMTVTKVPPGAVNSTFEVRKLLSDWDEGAVTWNSRLLDVLWESPGAEGPSDSSPNVSSTVPVGGQAAGYTFPSTTALVADVQDWVNNPGNNFGWLLESQD